MYTPLYSTKMTEPFENISICVFFQIQMSAFLPMVDVIIIAQTYLAHIDAHVASDTNCKMIVKAALVK